MVTFVVTLVRAWTRLYTARMAAEVRDARRAEIESDLWESQEDAVWSGDGSFALARQLFARFVLGIPDDLSWRYEHMGRPTKALRRVA